MTPQRSFPPSSRRIRNGQQLLVQLQIVAWKSGGRDAKSPSDSFSHFSIFLASPSLFFVSSFPYFVSVFVFCFASFLFSFRGTQRLIRRQFGEERNLILRIAILSPLTGFLASVFDSYLRSERTTFLRAPKVHLEKKAPVASRSPLRRTSFRG